MNTATAGQPKQWSYEELCNNCRDAVEEMDRLRWLVGDTALAIETYYGEHTAESFARDIGQNQSTVRNWKRVAKFYDEVFRAEQIALNQNLTYTYFRDALRLGDDKRLVSDWLAEVSSSGWSADEAARKLTERLGHKTIESAEGVIQSYSAAIGIYTVEIQVSKQDYQWLIETEKVTIRAK